MTIRSLVILGLALPLLLLPAVPASAQQSKCLASKTKCMSKKSGGLLKCHTLAETPGKPADPNANGCIDKVVAKFESPSDPAKGCFEKLENKLPNDCISLDDTAGAEAVVDSCVGAFVAAVDPPPTTQGKCYASKKKCVSKLTGGLLKCYTLALTPGKSPDPNANGCIDKALTKYNGGIDPTKGCFAKLEAKVPNDCAGSGDSSTVQGIVQSCVADMVDFVQNPPTTTSTSTPATTTSTTIVGGVELKGALTATPGRFNYNLTVGLPGANAACNTNFPGTHACTYSELQGASTAGDLIGLKDIANNTVTSFWAIDGSLPALSQCQDDVSSFLNWEYGTAHTPSRGRTAPLDNPSGNLGAIGPNIQCNFSSHWVGCCV